MFKRFFDRSAKATPEGYVEGWKFFELGLAHAGRYEGEKALEYYAKSIAACKNPAPYINRAKIFSRRLRYHEALLDLLEARKLDRAQSNEFVEVLRHEIGMAEAVTSAYKNGLREQLIEDLEQNDEDYVAGKIYSAAFDFNHKAWMAQYVLPKFARDHFYNELDNVRKFERLDLYPEVKEYLDLYPAEFIEEQVASLSDPEGYKKGEFKLHSFLCVYDQNAMTYIRRTLIYRLHERLLDSDYPGSFGGFGGFGGLSHSRPTVTKDAYRFIHGEDFSGE